MLTLRYLVKPKQACSYGESETCAYHGDRHVSNHLYGIRQLRIVGQMRSSTFWVDFLVYLARHIQVPVHRSVGELRIIVVV
jgi:hypothetical protein